MINDFEATLITNTERKEESEMSVEEALQLSRGATRPDLNGQRVRKPGNPGIFLIDRGVRRLIPNLDTYFTLFLNEQGEVTDINIDEIPLGSTITDGACLAKHSASPTIYLFDDGMKRPIANSAVFTQYHFNPNVQTLYRKVFLDFIRTGDQIG